MYMWPSNTNILVTSSWSTSTEPTSSTERSSTWSTSSEPSSTSQGMWNYEMVCYRNVYTKVTIIAHGCKAAVETMSIPSNINILVTSSWSTSTEPTSSTERSSTWSTSSEPTSTSQGIWNYTWIIIFNIFFTQLNDCHIFVSKKLN